MVTQFPVPGSRLWARRVAVCVERHLHGGHICVFLREMEQGAEQLSWW